MARPSKTGLDYFPLDIDFFDDEKITAISGEFGIKGEITAIKLLCAIYRNGYFIMWNELLKFKLLKSLPGISEQLLEGIVQRLVSWGFFDKALFDSTGVLTSQGIQRRYFNITKRRVTDSGDSPYLLVSAYRNPQKQGKNEFLHTETPDEEEFLHTETTQSKGKESKEKNSTDVEQKKAEQAQKMAAAIAATQTRKQEFYQSLVPYVERYGRETVRAFFDYWSEMNRQRTKMRFEKEITWELPRRLAYWASREKMPARQTNRQPNITRHDNTKQYTDF